MQNDLRTFLNLKEKTIIIGGDHHAHEKTVILYEFLKDSDLKVELVPYDASTSDYIAQAKFVAQRVSSDPLAFAGILGCRNGFGVTVLANKYPFVFGARCDDVDQAVNARKINYVNIMTFGSDFVTSDELENIVQAWLRTDYDLNAKNIDRLNKLLEIQSEIKNAHFPSGDSEEREKLIKMIKEDIQDI